VETGSVKPPVALLCDGPQTCTSAMQSVPPCDCTAEVRRSGTSWTRNSPLRLFPTVG
jgi:hypothetical protein